MALDCPKAKKMPLSRLLLFFLLSLIWIAADSFLHSKYQWQGHIRLRRTQPTLSSVRSSDVKNGDSPSLPSASTIKTKLEGHSTGGAVVLKRHEFLNGLLTVGTVFFSTVFAPQSVEASGGIAPGAVKGSTPDSWWQPLSVAQRASLTSSELVYDEAFATYLTRFLITYDASIRSWWVAQAALVDSSAPSTARLAARKMQLADLAASVSAGLASPRWSSSTIQASPPDSLGLSSSPPSQTSVSGGAENLFGALQENYLKAFLRNDSGGAGGYDLEYGAAREAARQLCVLFAMLPAPSQPTTRIAELVAKIEGSYQKRPKDGASASGKGQSSDFSAVFSFSSFAPNVDVDDGSTSGPTVRRVAYDKFVVFDEEDRQIITLPPEAAVLRRVADGPFEPSLYGGGRLDVFGSLPPDFVNRLLRPTGSSSVSSSGSGQYATALTAVKRERALDVGTYLRFFVAGAGASAIAHTALTPVDMLKTRLQTQPERYGGGGPVLAVRTIWAEEGPGAFLQGAGSTAAGYFLAGAIAFGGTEILKRAAIAALGPQVAIANSFAVVLVAGGLAVACCTLAVAPFEKARIRLVSEPTFAPSLPQALVKIAAEPKGLYNGLPALLIKEVPFHATKFAVFDTVSSTLKQAFESYALFSSLPPSSSAAAVSVISGVAAGITAAIVSQPADATFTRCNQQQQRELQSSTNEEKSDNRIGGTISSTTDDDASTANFGPVAAFQELLEEGSLGVGLSSRCVFGGLLVAVQFATYDALKAALQVAPSDLQLFLDVLSGVAGDANGATLTGTF